MLEMRREADQLFRQNEVEKNIRRRHEADQLKNFHVDQYVRSWQEAKCKILLFDIQLIFGI